MTADASATLLPDEWEFTEPPVMGTEVRCPRCDRWSPTAEWEAGRFERDLGCAQWYLICPLCPAGADRVFGSFDVFEQPVPVRTRLDGARTRG